MSAHFGVLNACGELFGREAAEHHRVHGAETRTREHRGDGLRHERHVDDYAVSSAHAALAREHAGQLGHLHAPNEELLLVENARAASQRRS